MSDQTTSTTPAAAVWRRPVTLAELRAALEVFGRWEPVERARRAPELIEAAKAVLADERSTAMGEAKAAGMGVTALARELGVTRQKVYDALGRATTARPAAGVDAAAAAVVDVSGYRLLFDSADQAWLVLAGDRVIADHDGLGDDPAGAEAACDWAAGVLADEGAGPVGWQRAGVAGGAGYVARPVHGPGHNHTDLEG